MIKTNLIESERLKQFELARKIVDSHRTSRGIQLPDFDRLKEEAKIRMARLAIMRWGEGDVDREHRKLFEDIKAAQKKREVLPYTFTTYQR